MIFLALILVLFSQNLTMSNYLPQQYVLLVVLLLLCKKRTSDIRYDNETEFKSVIPEIKDNSQSCQDSDMSIYNNESLSSDNNYDKIQRTDNIRDFSALNNDIEYDTMDTDMSSYSNRHHYFDTKIYHNKKASSDKRDNDTVKDTGDNVPYLPFLENDSEDKTYFKTISQKESSCVSINPHDHTNIGQSKPISSDKCDSDNISEIENNIDDFSDLNNQSNNEINKISAINVATNKKTAQKTFTERKEKVSVKKSSDHKKTSADAIKKKYFGKTISVVLSDVGIITGTVVFGNSSMIGMKLEDGSTMYINNNNIASYY